jgi:hypothetical protein
LSNDAGIIVSALTGVVSLAVFVYLHKRAKIPKLSFDGYFKTEQPFLTGHESSKVTTYCVRIENINLKSEVEIELCAGSLTVNNSIYKTVWMSTDKRHDNFVKDALIRKMIPSDYLILLEKQTQNAFPQHTAEESAIMSRWNWNPQEAVVFHHISRM